MNDFFAVRNLPAFRTPRFNPGDKVRVVCTAPTFNDEMRKSIGNFFTVSGHEGFYVRLTGSEWYWELASLMLCERDGYGPAEYDDHKDFMRKATIATRPPSDAVLLRTRRLKSDGTLDEFRDTYFHCLKHWLDYSSHEGWMMDRYGTYYYIVETLPLFNSGVIAPVVYSMNFRASASMKRAVQQASQYEIVLPGAIDDSVKQAIQFAEDAIASLDCQTAGMPGTLRTFGIVEGTNTTQGDCSMGLPRIPKIENTTLIDDVPINHLSDDTLLEQIRSLEAAKESLQKYQGKVPLVVTKKIEDVDAAIAMITELLDERFVAKNPTPPATPAA